jgi:hypothetical protein
LGQPIQDRQRERSGLAGSRLGTAQQIAAFEKMRDRLRLDGRGLLIVFVSQRELEGFDQIEIGK